MHKDKGNFLHSDSTEYQKSFCNIRQKKKQTEIDLEKDGMKI